jgi:hypothetical protein
METSNSQHQQHLQHQYPMIDELLALFQQESASCYQPADYLAYLKAPTVAETVSAGPDDENDDSFMGDIISIEADLNAVHNGVRARKRQEYVTMRQKMGEWAYDGKYKYCRSLYTHANVSLAHIACLLHTYILTVIDYHGMSREVGALAMNYTDRYLQALVDQRPHDHNHQEDPEELPSGRSYQLIVMTGLYLAIKLTIGSYFGDRLDARTMCAMSRGMFTRDKLLAMERDLLHTLQWRMHPPTAKVFLNHYLELLANYYGACDPDDQHAPTWQVVDKKQLHAVRNEADFMLEHAVLDYHFCGHYPSVIAIAALCNTTSVVWPNNANPLTLLKQIMGHAVAWDDGQVAECRQRLHALMVNYHSHQAQAAGQKSSETADFDQRTRSPVSVLADPTLATDKTTATATTATAAHHPS